jgi:hypothetical protein
MHVGWLTPKTRSSQAGPKGEGVYATSTISRGETVAGFGGYIVHVDGLSSLNDWQLSRTIQVADDLFLASHVLDDPADFINHSCDPNCGIVGSHVLVAMRDIAVGEELSFDYAMCDSNPYDEFECFCESPLCRGKVTAEDWMSGDLQDRYDGFFSAYLARRIAEMSMASFSTASRRWL